MLYLMTQGKYSDFTILGLYEGPPDVNLPAIVDSWKALHPDQANEYHLDEDAFRDFVAAEAGLKPVDGDELRLGQYGCISMARQRNLEDCNVDD